MGSEHFDSKATTWDQDPGKVAHAAAVAEAVVAAAAPSEQTRLLEYGAGTGLVSQALVGRVGRITLADNSAGMRQVMVGKLESGIFPADTRVWDLDLESDPPPEETFDLVVTSMVLHHVHDLGVVLSAFTTLLAPGGHLCVADLDAEDGSFHAKVHDFGGHPGFDRSALASAMETAGLREVEVADCTTITKDGGTFPVFLATAQR